MQPPPIKKNQRKNGYISDFEDGYTNDV